MPLPQQFMDELHDRNDISEVIGSYVELKRRGRLLTALCPFHNEKTPSFTVYPDTQNFYCFGCGAGGDVITFIKKYENLEYIEAVKLLADRAGMTMPDDTDRSAADRKKRILEANRLAARWFFEQLNGESGREARGYLRRRGLADATIARFGIGWAPESWDGLRDTLRRKGYRDEELIEASLCSPGKNGGCYDFFRARVMFPVIDVRGQIVAFSGRTMGKTDPRKYVNTRDTPVFKKSRVLFGLNFAKNAGTRRAILAEGQMDVISLHQAGFTDAVATLGTAITDEHARVLSRYADEVVISYDADEAGQKATRRAIDTLRAAGIPVRVVQIEGGKDPDELIRSGGPSAYKLLLDRASGSMEYELDRAKRRYDLEKAEGKVGYLADAVQVLSRCASATEREVWAGRVSGETGVDKGTILAGAAKAQKARRAAEEKKEDAKFAQSIGERYNVKSYERQNVGSVSAERRLIALLCANPDFCKALTARVRGADFVSGEAGRIFDAVCGLIASGDFTGFSSAASALEPELTAVLSGILAESSGVQFSPQDADFFVDKILERREKPSEDALRGMDAAAIQKLIKEKKA